MTERIGAKHIKKVKLCHVICILNIYVFRDEFEAVEVRMTGQRKQGRGFISVHG